MTLSADGIQPLMVFLMDGQRYALPLKAVERIIRAAAATPVPEAPPFILGLINLAGRILSVISLRRCLGLADRAITPTDQFLIARTSHMSVALVVDEVQGLSDLDMAATVIPGTVMPGEGGHVHCITRINGDIVLIYDLDTLFSMDDQERIRVCQELALGGEGTRNERNHHVHAIADN